MGVTLARQIAFDVLRRVEAEGAFASDLLHARLTDKTKREDAALATELTMGVLRWQRLLDFQLGQNLKKPAASLDLEVLIALRLGLYQLRFLERVPASAAVNESVELVKRARKRSAAPLVNAVLRRAAGEARAPLDKFLPPHAPEAERLGILYSHPTWMVERWLKRFGAARTIALLEANNRAPRLALAVDGGATSGVQASLREAGVDVKPGQLLRNALLVESGNPAATEAFRRGRISIQDEASQLIPHLLGVKPGESVLDLCAAPGGKTATLARGAAPGGLVIAGDRHAPRLRAMREQLERLGIRNVYMVALDARNPLPLRISFDRILVDAPCSGTGTLARNPEIRWRLRPEDLADFYGRQVALLSSAAEHLKPDGRLVYSTCSLESEENEEVVRDVARRSPRLGIVSGAQLGSLLEPVLAAGVAATTLFDEGGAFRTWPPEHRTDGFFAMALEKR